MTTLLRAGLSTASPVPVPQQAAGQPRCALQPADSKSKIATLAAGWTAAFAWLGEFCRAIGASEAYVTLGEPIRRRVTIVREEAAMFDVIARMRRKDATMALVIPKVGSATRIPQ